MSILSTSTFFNHFLVLAHTQETCAQLQVGVSKTSSCHTRWKMLSNVPKASLLLCEFRKSQPERPLLEARTGYDGLEDIRDVFFNNDLKARKHER